jgi:hypothetical protein
MKLLIALGEKTQNVTPYTMTQVEDYAYEERAIRDICEKDVLEALTRDYNGIPARLLWIEQEGVVPPGKDFLAALADGGQIPWVILQEVDLRQNRDTTS